MHKSPICLLQSPLANASNIYHDKKQRDSKPFKAPSVVSVASSIVSQNTQSPETIIRKLQSDIECWQFRYESLEKQYTAKISSELDVERREKQLKDDKIQIIHSLKQLEEQQEAIDNLENEVETLKNQLNYCQQQLEINQSTIKQKDDEILRLNNQRDMNLNQKPNVDYQHRDKLNQVTIKQQQVEILNLMKKLETINEDKENKSDNQKLQEVMSAKQLAEKSLKLKEQEFDALKILFHEKELDLKEGFVRIQKLNNHIVELQNEKQILLQKLEEREKNFAQFKLDVESEVDNRLKQVRIEKEALQDQLNQKLVQIQRLSQLQPTLEHYQKEFVKAQLSEEALQQQVQVMESELNKAKQQQQLTEALLLSKTTHYEVQIKELEKENCELSQTGKRIQEQFREQVKILNDEIKDLENECQRFSQECTNWKTKFIQINKDYHLKQEEAILLQTELHVQKKALRDCKLGGA